MTLFVMTAKFFVGVGTAFGAFPRCRTESR